MGWEKAKEIDLYLVFIEARNDDISYMLWSIARCHGLAAALEDRALGETKADREAADPVTREVVTSADMPLLPGLPPTTS